MISTNALALFERKLLPYEGYTRYSTITRYERLRDPAGDLYPYLEVDISGWDEVEVKLVAGDFIPEAVFDELKAVWLETLTELYDEPNDYRREYDRVGDLYIES